MYVRRFFGRDSKLQATEMINDIHQSFLQILDDADWMDSSTKFQAKEKARAVRIHVGYPEEHLSDAKLTALYSTYNFKVDDYLGNARNLVKEAVDLYFGKLRFPVNKNDWVTHGKTAVVNAFYLPLENAIRKRKHPSL
jgi:membrane metallo-endopeptidase-like protein 1